MTQRPRRLRLRSSRPVSSELSLAPKGRLSTTGQVTHSPSWIGYTSGKLPYNRLLVHTDGRGMAESSSRRAAHTIDSRPFQLSEVPAAAKQQPDQS